eukprot:4058330-Pleurochrysis_carterae.AAC.1
MSSRRGVGRGGCARVSPYSVVRRRECASARLLAYVSARIRVHALVATCVCARRRRPTLPTPTQRLRCDAVRAPSAESARSRRGRRGVHQRRASPLVSDAGVDGRGVGSAGHVELIDLSAPVGRFFSFGSCWLVWISPLSEHERRSG